MWRQRIITKFHIKRQERLDLCRKQRMTHILSLETASEPSRTIFRGNLSETFSDSVDSWRERPRLSKEKDVVFFIHFHSLQSFRFSDSFEAALRNKNKDETISFQRMRKLRLSRSLLLPHFFALFSKIVQTTTVVLGFCSARLRATSVDTATSPGCCPATRELRGRRSDLPVVALY